MSVLWIAILAVSGAPSSESDTASAAKAPAVIPAVTPVAPRSGKELKEAAQEALRRLARVEDKDTEAAGRELLVLFKEVERDTRMSQADREDLRTKLRARLLRLAQQIAHQRAKQAPDSVRVDRDQAHLNQMGGFGQRGFGGGFGQQGFGGGGFGQQGFGGGFGGNGMGQQADAGEDLVQLIQTTVAPKSWESGGGPGTIYYWRGQRAIVIRNTAEVHGNVNHVLRQLEAANR